MRLRHAAALVTAAACTAAIVTTVAARNRDRSATSGAPPDAPNAPDARDVPPAAALVRPASEADRRQAGDVLAAYLDAARDGSPTVAAIDTLLGCGARDAFVLPITLLAASRVLATAGGGDTLVGRAVVVTVAEQRADRRHPDRYLARQRVQVDTLEWDLVRDAEGTGWQVCNGLQFGFHEPEEASTWYPLGTSRRTTRTLVDSVYAAWSTTLPMAR